MFSDYLSRTPDPLRAWRLRCVVVGLGGVIALVPTAFWALRLIGSSNAAAAVAPTETVHATVQSSDVSVDRSVFEKSLWSALPTSNKGPSTVPPEAPRALPLEIDLIGVTESGGELIAALYDRRADRLLLVKHGDSVGEAKVSELTRERVTFSQDGSELVLTRRRPGP